MGKYFDMLMEDVRMKEGLHSCMNCGVCTGVCPAAEFYNYDPRQIVNIVQTRDDDAIEELLKAIRSGIAASACRAARAVRAAIRRGM
jgi:heterodisulfide reductase subunit C